jgi:hypothetical protein
MKKVTRVLFKPFPFPSPPIIIIMNLFLSPLYYYYIFWLLKYYQLQHNNKKIKSPLIKTHNIFFGKDFVIRFYTCSIIDCNNN